MPRYKSWTDEMDTQLISIINANKDKKIRQVLKEAAEIMSISFDGVRNHWYSPQIKQKRGISLKIDLRLKQNEDTDSKEEFKTIKEESTVIQEDESTDDVKPIQSLHRHLPMESEYSKEAKLAINDFKETIELMMDSLTRLLHSNVSLLRENEQIKLEHNRMVRDHNELQESYMQMLKMINQARILALREEDHASGLSGSEARSKTKFKMDSNGSLNSVG